jgi:hypothetical protein
LTHKALKGRPAAFEIGTGANRRLVLLRAIPISSLIAARPRWENSGPHVTNALYICDTAECFEVFLDFLHADVRDAVL